MNGKRSRGLLLALLFSFVTLPALGQAGEYDNGMMWTFDYPPVEHF